jgi:hypothetical protein
MIIAAERDKIERIESHGARRKCRHRGGSQFIIIVINNTKEKGY